MVPADIGLGQGQIVTTDGRTSSQIDVVIFDKRILPPITHEASIGIFPLEGTLAAIEVKSVLTSAELQSSIACAKQLYSFVYWSGSRDPKTGVVTPHEVLRVLPAVFALDSDLSADGKSELDRLIENGGAGIDGILALCVAGRGFWFNNAGKWYKAAQTFPLAEVAAFTLSVLETFQRVSESRKRPDLTYYVFDAAQLPIPGRDHIFPKAPDE